MNIDKLDRIIMSQHDVDTLFAWRDSHKDYVRNFKSALKSGVIVLYLDNKEKYHTQVFEDKGYYYLYTIFNDTVGKVHEVKWSKITRIGETLSSKLGFDKDHEFDYNQTVISLHASLMAYMEYFSDKKEYVEVQEVTTTKTKKKSGKSSSKKSPIRIRKKVYKVNITKEATIMDKRRYERKVQGWNVAGHWRTLKSGKKTWIPSYPKGDKRNITPKDYKI